MRLLRLAFVLFAMLFVSVGGMYACGDDLPPQPDGSVTDQAVQDQTVVEDGTTDTTGVEDGFVDTISSD